jgi:hypothetical protein
MPIVIPEEVSRTFDDVLADSGIDHVKIDDGWDNGVNTYRVHLDTGGKVMAATIIHGRESGFTVIDLGLIKEDDPAIEKALQLAEGLEKDAGVVKTPVEIKYKYKKARR